MTIPASPWDHEDTIFAAHITQPAFSSHSASNKQITPREPHTELPSKNLTEEGNDTLQPDLSGIDTETGLANITGEGKALQKVTN